MLELDASWTPETGADVRRENEVLKRENQKLMRKLVSVSRRAVAANRMAHHDVLTGLPNRLLLIKRLQRAIAEAFQRQMLLALLFIDLDGFKEVRPDRRQCPCRRRCLSLWRRRIRRAAGQHRRPGDCGQHLAEDPRADWPPLLDRGSRDTGHRVDRSRHLSGRRRAL
jgi:Diguanylate cyclase, GGDEF domain